MWLKQLRIPYMHGTFTANNRVGFAIDSTKSAAKGNRNSKKGQNFAKVCTNIGTVFEGLVSG